MSAWLSLMWTCLAAQAQWIWPTVTCCTKTSVKVWRVCCSTVTCTWSTWSHRTTWSHSVNLTGCSSSDRYGVTVGHHNTTLFHRSVLNQVFMCSCCSSRCCLLQSRRCPQPSECRRVSLREKPQDRRWKRWETTNCRLIQRFKFSESLHLAGWGGGLGECVSSSASVS